jgi:hypothetical protein
MREHRLRVPAHSSAKWQRTWLCSEDRGKTSAVFNSPFNAGEVGAVRHNAVTVDDPGHTHVGLVNDPGHVHALGVWWGEKYVKWGVSSRFLPST